MRLLGILCLCACEIPGGTGDGSLEHWELDGGMWCTTAVPVETCLSVNDGRYLLERGLCVERGRVNGGLEFSPDTDSRVCMPGVEAFGSYDAEAYRTAVGIDLQVGGTRLEMGYLAD